METDEKEEEVAERNRSEKRENENESEKGVQKRLWNNKGYKMGEETYCEC